LGQNINDKRVKKMRKLDLPIYRKAAAELKSRGLM
jgi:hypothetical protein